MAVEAAGSYGESTIISIEFAGRMLDRQNSFT
jgi:hypothetical protein